MMLANQETQEARSLNVGSESPISASTSVITVIPYKEGSTKGIASHRTSAKASRLKAVGSPCARLISCKKKASTSSCYEEVDRILPTYIASRIPQNYYTDTDPESLEILSHQENKYNSTYTPPYKFFELEKLPRRKELTYLKCNECEVFEGADTNCKHLEDEGPYDYSFNVDRVGEHIKAVRFDSVPGEPPASTKTLKYEMFKSDALSGLLSENTDEHASHFVFVFHKSYRDLFRANLCLF